MLASCHSLGDIMRGNGRIEDAGAGKDFFQFMKQKQKGSKQSSFSAWLFEQICIKIINKLKKEVELSHLEQAVGSSACKHSTESPPWLESRPENTHCCCSQRDSRLERGADSVVLLSTINNLLYPLTYYRPFNKNLPNWNSQLKEGKHFASWFQ